MFPCSAFLFVATGGTAATAVTKHRRHRIVGAWLSLRKWYEGQGSKDSIVRRALQTLQSLTLARDTVGELRLTFLPLKMP